MTVAENLKDAYNDRKTFRNERLKSKTNKFYRSTRLLRVTLMVLSLILFFFQRPSWCEDKLNQTFLLTTGSGFN
jgi:hypothetical protein